MPRPRPDLRDGPSGLRGQGVRTVVISEPSSPNRVAALTTAIDPFSECRPACLARKLFRLPAGPDPGPRERRLQGCYAEEGLSARAAVAQLHSDQKIASSHNATRGTAWNGCRPGATEELCEKPNELPIQPPGSRTGSQPNSGMSQFVESRAVDPRLPEEVAAMTLATSPTCPPTT